MPKVPLYDSPQVREQPTPTPRIVNPLGAQEASVAGKQIGAMGDAAGRASGQAFDLALKAQQEANTLRAEDAANQWLETANSLTENREGTGWRDQRGLAAFQRPDGKSLADEFSEKLDRRASEVSGALANDEQRRLFASRVDQTRTQLRGQIGAHEGNEFNTYTVSVRETSISQAMKSVALNYTNPELVAQGIDTIRASARDLARLAGKPAEWAEAQASEAVSKAHGAALGAMFAKQDFTAAEAYLKLHKDEIEPEQLTTASLQITAQGEARVALDAVNGTEGEAWRDVNPGSMDSLLSLTGAAESQNRDFAADGSPIVSPAGARYRMQVMPATARDPGFGIRPAADDSPAEYNRVGKELLGKLVGKYDGDVRKALAAYNWGSGNVDRVLEDAKRVGVDWFSLLPSGRRPQGKGYSAFNDVQGYVNKIHGAWVSGGGRASQMTGTDFVDSAVARARAASGGELSASAELKVRQLAGARWNDIQSTKREQTADATNQVLALSQSGLSLPEIQGTALWLGLPADSKATITDYVSGRQAKDQYGKYLFHSDPEQLSQFKSEGEIRALRPLLGDQLTGQLLNTWRSAGKPEAATIDAEDLNQVAIGLGLDPYRKNTSTEDREKLGRVKFGIEQAIAAEQSKLRRPLTREEKLAVAQREAARTVQVQGWGKVKDTPALLIDPERVQSVVVPQEQRRSVAQALQKLYVETGDEQYNPSNENNMRRFWVAGQTTAGGMTY